MNKLLSILLLLALGFIAAFFYLFRFEAISLHALPLPPSTPAPEVRIFFPKVANGLSNYLLGVEFSLLDKVPEEINEEDLSFYEQALRSSKEISGKPEIVSAIASIFSDLHKLRSKSFNTFSKRAKLANMKKVSTDTEESFRERVELRRYNLENEIGRETETLLSKVKSLRSKAMSLGSTYKKFSLKASDPFVAALASRTKGPASRGYPPPLDEAPTKGEVKTLEAQVMSVTAEGTIAVEMEYVSGPVSYLRRIGGEAGYKPVMIAVPGNRVLYLRGLRHGVVMDQKINIVARRYGDFEYINSEGIHRTVDRWNFIRFVHNQK